MIEQLVTIKLEDGLQARPAAQFVQEANRFQSEIFIEKDGKQVNAKSIMGVMSLAIVKNEEVLLKIEGEDADVAMKHLTTFISTP